VHRVQIDIANVEVTICVSCCGKHMPQLSGHWNSPLEVMGVQGVMNVTLSLSHSKLIKFMSILEQNNHVFHMGRHVVWKIVPHLLLEE
jgi:hypothetical protein